MLTPGKLSDEFEKSFGPNILPDDKTVLVNTPHVDMLAIGLIWKSGAKAGFSDMVSCSAFEEVKSTMASFVSLLQSISRSDSSSLSVPPVE